MKCNNKLMKTGSLKRVPEANFTILNFPTIGNRFAGYIGKVKPACIETRCFF